MRAITVRQPWAWAIMHGGKDVENRTRNIAGSYRGPVAITAGLVTDWQAAIGATLRYGIDENGNEWGGIDGAPLVKGSVVGVVNLTDVHSASVIGGCGRLEHDCPEHGTCRHHCSTWAFGPNPAGGWFQHLVLANPRPLPTPIPVRGRLGLWTLPDDIAAQVEEALR